MLEMFGRLQGFHRHTHLEHHLLQSNQDLGGFFTSTPAERIEDAARRMIERYENLHHDDDNMMFRVFPREKDVTFRILKGSKRAKRGRACHIHLEDILKLSSLSSQTSRFVQSLSSFSKYVAGQLAIKFLRF